MWMYVSVVCVCVCVCVCVYVCVCVLSYNTSYGIPYLICEICLQGLAYIILSGATPSDSTVLSSSLLAQSNPAPSLASTERMAGSLLHLTAGDEGEVNHAHH